MTKDMNNFLIGANWKMNKNPKEARDYIQEIKKLVSRKHQKHFVFFAPALVLSVLKEELQGTSFYWGAQNCYFKDEGSFTGENSPQVLKNLGASHCLVGHSERRTYFFETDKGVQKKTQALLRNSITPLVCVGESAEERKKGLSFQAIERQLKLILHETSVETSLFVAYEPCWAIGTADSASPEQISDMYKYIQGLCAKFGKKLCFLYGGSVNKENAGELIQIPGVQGFLVGGASLEARSFYDLFQVVYEKK